MLCGPGCGLSPITAQRPIWQRWSAPVVGCGCATAVVIGKQQARPRPDIAQMAGRGFNWIDWLFLCFSIKTYAVAIFFKQDALDVSEERVCDCNSCKALVSCFSSGAIFTELLP